MVWSRDENSFTYFGKNILGSFGFLWFKSLKTYHELHILKKMVSEVFAGKHKETSHLSVLPAGLGAGGGSGGGASAGQSVRVRSHFFSKSLTNKWICDVETLVMTEIWQHLSLAARPPSSG